MIDRDHLRVVDDRAADERDSFSGATRDRACAAADRAKAAEDRLRAAADRTEAARELAEAVQLRLQAANDLMSATTDDLTGAWARKSGLEEVMRELARARRTGDALVLAFVDVDGLKQVNDTRGHLAGDTLLRLVGETIRAHVRPYDTVVRYGGDEFVCAMSSLAALEARERFGNVAEALRVIDAEHSITFGVAEAVSVDSLQSLIARADAELLKARRRRYAPRTPLRAGAER